MSKGKRNRDARREARESRERGVDSRAEANAAIDSVEIELPSIRGGARTATVRRSMLGRLVEDGVVHEHGGRYYADDRDVLNARILSHTETMICDFCSSPEPLWLYDADDTAISVDPPVADGETWIRASTAAWTACDRCSTRIERGEFQQLVDEIAAQFAEKFNAETPDERAVLGLMLANTVGAFRAARRGERTLL